MEQERIAKLETQVESIKEDVGELKSEVREIHSRITTGNREIVTKMDDMQTRLEHRMNAQALAAQQQHQAISEDIKKEIDKIDDRVSSLEKWKWYVIGGSAVIGFLLATVADLSKFIK